MPVNYKIDLKPTLAATVHGFRSYVIKTALKRCGITSPIRAYPLQFLLFGYEISQQGLGSFTVPDVMAVAKSFSIKINDMPYYDARTSLLGRGLIEIHSNGMPVRYKLTVKGLQVVTELDNVTRSLLSGTGT